MQNTRQIIASLCCVLLTAQTVRANPDFDPFAASGKPTGSVPEKAVFTTTGFYRVRPIIGFNPDKVDPRDWPQIEAPTRFNRHFDGLPTLWRVAGGFFAAFDGGEWGGSLFYRNDNDKMWTRVIDTNIQDLEEFGENEFLAAGGISHGDLSTGTAYIITRKPTGRWATKKVFDSRSGIPCVVGTSETEIEPKLTPTSEKLIVLSMGDSSGLVGVSHTGTVYFLGEPKPSEPADSGQPATPSKDKPSVEVQAPSQKSKDDPR